MTWSVFIDAVESGGIIVICACLIYVIIRLERMVTQGADRLGAIVQNQAALQETLERIWKRVDEIEQRQGVRGS